MKDLIRYVGETQNDSFLDRTFSDVDSVVLSQLSYLYFERCNQNKSIHAYSEEEILLMSKETLYPSLNHQLFLALQKSDRFKNLQICDVHQHFDVAQETQFAALTFVQKDFAYIVFRGTDLTVAGWKEDFNMSFLDVIPGQASALAYIEQHGKKWLHHTIYIGGHSKGGNLACFAAMHCSKEIQEHIQAVYNHDGPGFKKDVFLSEAYQQIADRVKKTIPQDSLVGILLHHEKTVKIIKSNGIGGLLQHNLYTWRIKNGQLIEEKKTTRISQAMDASLFEWLEAMEEKERKEISEAIYQIFTQSEVDNLNQFREHMFDSVIKMLGSYHQLDAKKRKQMTRITAHFIGLFFKHFWRSIRFKEKV